MPKSINVQVTRAQERRLWQLRCSSSNRRIWARATAILMLAAGAPTAAIMKSLTISQNTLTNWKQRWNNSGIFGLGDGKRSGRPPKANAPYLVELKKAVAKNPTKFGYVFTVWSSARLAVHLRRKTGVQIGPKQVRHLLKKSGFVFGRPKHTLRSRQDPKEVRSVRRRLEALK